MKKSLFIIYNLLFIISTAAQTLTVKVTNPLPIPRRDVPVVVDLHKVLKDKAANIMSATVQYVAVSQRPTTTDNLPSSASDAPLACQLDDIDGDLIPDELAFICDIPASTTLTFKAVCSSVLPMKNYPPRVNAFMKVWDRKYRYPRINSIEYQGSNPPLATYDAIYGHGAQWETELVGFRVYIDHRQSIDIYGKPRPALTLDSTNFYSTRQDIAAGLGCDILFAGASVGAGSFRGYVNEQPTYVDSVQARGQRIIASGPVRTIVEVTDKGWLYNRRTLNMRQLYTTWAGHRDVQVDITIRNTSPTDSQLSEQNDEPILFCTGVQKLEQQNQGFIMPDGLAASWGLNIPDKAAEDLVEGVGLAVYVPAPYLNSTKEDQLNYLAIIHPDAFGHIRYHLAICALMEEGGFQNFTQWQNWTRQWQEQLNQPCQITASKI